MLCAIIKRNSIDYSRKNKKMKKFEGILLCTDLDGTLLRTDGSISEENLGAIEHFKSEGGLFTFITGRMPVYSSHLCTMARTNAPYGCGNGCGIYDPDKKDYLWRKDMIDDIHPLLDFIESSTDEVGIMVNTFDTVYFIRNNPAMSWWRSITGMPNIIKRRDEITEPIAKIVFGDHDPLVIDELENLILSSPLSKKFDVVRSEKTLFEVVTKDLSKGTVLMKMAELFGIDKKRTVAVGDYYNDISMIKAAGVGIAVSNACDELKANANRITVSNDEHAIAKIIYDIENGEIRF